MALVYYFFDNSVTWSQNTNLRKKGVQVGVTLLYSIVQMSDYKEWCQI